MTATAWGPEASEEKSKRNSHTSHGRGPAGAQEPSACRVEKTPTDPTGANRTREEQALTKMGHHGALGIEPYQPGTIDHRGHRALRSQMGQKRGDEGEDRVAVHIKSSERLREDIDTTGALGRISGKMQQLRSPASWSLRVSV